MLRGFATISYFADDMTAAEAWYTELLGTPPYFRRDHGDNDTDNTGNTDSAPAYLEYRIGDHQAEVGLIDSRFAPHDVKNGPAGVIMNWHVDDLPATLDRLLAMGATQLEGITPRGEGFVTASVTDPFGNIIGIMTNPHYLDMLAARTA